MHSKAMWPMHGKYTCPDCLREFPVEWTAVHSESEAPPPASREFVWSKAAGSQFMDRLKRSDTM